MPTVRVCFLTREEFRQWLRGRLDAGETQAAVGNSLGVSQPTLFRWVTGIARPSGTALLLAELQMRTPQGLTCSEWPAGSE